MNLDKLARDWEEDPQLNYLGFETVEALAAHLRSCHDSMMNGELGCLGYLYRQQTLRLRELQQEMKKHERK